MVKHSSKAAVSTKAKHLTKEQELHLGRLIQNKIAAEEKLAAMEVGSNASTELLMEIIDKGNVAVTKLVEANVGLVWSGARAFKSSYPGGPEIEDLAQEGMIGLMTAVYKYDPEKGNKFSTVAYQWIRQSIGRGTNTTGRLVRLPENRVSDYINISKIRAENSNSGLTTSEINQKVMNETGLTWGEMVNITNAASTPASLNKVVGSGDEKGRELMDFVGADRASESSEELVVKTEIFNILHEKISEMPEVTRDVVASSFLMDIDGKVLVPKEVKLKHKISSPRFKRILNDALEDIRTNLADLDINFSDFLD